MIEAKEKLTNGEEVVRRLLLAALRLLEIGRSIYTISSII